MNSPASDLLDTSLSLEPDRRDYLVASKVQGTFFDDDYFATRKEHITRIVWRDAREALARARILLNAATLTGDPYHRVLASLALGNVHATGLQSYTKAADIYREAAAIADGCGDVAATLKAYVGLIYVYGMLGRYNEALRLGALVRARARSREDWSLYLQATNNLAIVHKRWGEYVRALALYDENANVLECHLRDDPDYSTHWSTLELNRAGALWSLNRYHEAIAVASTVLAMHKLHGDRYRRAKAIEQIGLASLYLGRTNYALTHFRRAKSVYVDANLPRDIAQIQLYEAKCMLGLNDPVAAEQLCDEVIAFAESAGLEQEQARTLVYRAMARRMRDEVTMAQQDLSRASRIFDAHGDEVGYGMVCYELSRLLLKIGKPTDAIVIAEYAITLFDDLDLYVFRALSLLVYAQAARRLGTLRAATRAFDEVRTIGRNADLAWLVHRACSGLAAVSAQQGDTDTALARSGEAVEAFEQMLRGMTMEFRSGYLAAKPNVYGQAIELTLPENPQTAFAYVLRAKACRLLDVVCGIDSWRLQALNPIDQYMVDRINQLQEHRRRLEERYRPFRPKTIPDHDGDILATIRAVENQIERTFRELQIHNATYASMRTLSISSVETIQPFLASTTRLIEYFAVDDILWAFVVGPDALQARPIAAIREIDDLIRRWRVHQKFAATLEPHHIAAHLPVARRLLNRLYEATIAPIARLIEEAERLYVAPYGSLNYLPFAALYDMESDRYLVEKAAITLLPSASVLAALAARRRQTPWPHHPLVLGHSQDDTLPHTLHEAGDVAATIDADVYLEEQATRARFLESGIRRPLIHVAAHGVFRPEAPLFSSLYLADGAVTTLDFLDTRLETGLLAFSTCESGLGTGYSGDEVLGLSRACLYAGAQSLLLSLWRIDDHSTYDLMVAFYTHVGRGISPAEALARAQREHIGTEHAAHPFFWAAFHVVGDAFVPIR